MTLLIFGSESAPGIRDSRRRAPSLTTADSDTDLIGLFKLDRLPSDRRLICHWHREPDGRIACYWEPDIVPIPSR
jgi:hypothetical protein